MSARRKVTTIEQSQNLIAELANGTDPSLLHALRVAALSPRMNLASEAGYGSAICHLRNSPLPPREELVSILKQARRLDGGPAYGLMASHIDALYSIDEFWFERGAVMPDIGVTLAEQRAWRCYMNSQIRGMGFKCISWGLFIYQPVHCQLLTLDTHHADRLGLDYTSISRDNRTSHELYMYYEAQVIAEVTELFPDYLPTVGAACLWFNQRGKGYESHAGLNCRVQEGAYECLSAD